MIRIKEELSRVQERGDPKTGRARGRGRIRPHGVLACADKSQTGFEGFDRYGFRRDEFSNARGRLPLVGHVRCRLHDREHELTRIQHQRPLAQP